MATERFILYSPSSSTNGFGERVLSYSAGVTVWAELIEMRADEQLAKSTLHDGKDMVKLKCRWHADITRNTRILWRDTTYDITDVSEDGRRKHLYVTASRVTNGN